MQTTDDARAANRPFLQAESREAQRAALAAHSLGTLWGSFRRALFPLRFALRGLGSSYVRFVCCALLVFAVLERIQPQSHVDLYPAYVAARLANEGQWDHIYHRSIW